MGTSNTITLTVNDTSPPTLVYPGTPPAVSEGAAVTITPTTITDADANSFTATGLPAWLTINAAHGVISGTAPRCWGRRLYVQGQRQGRRPRGDQQHHHVDGERHLAADAGLPQRASVNEAAVLTITPTTVTDADAGSFTAAGLPAWLTINVNTGVISGTVPQYADGVYTFTASAKDGALATTSNTITLTVNDTSPPTLVYPGDRNCHRGLRGDHHPHHRDGRRRRVVHGYRPARLADHQRRHRRHFRDRPREFGRRLHVHGQRHRRRPRWGRATPSP